MEQKNNSGAIFRNVKKEKETQPDYKGMAVIDGKDKEIAAWVKTSQKGTQYLSIKISDSYEKKEVENDPLPF